MAYERAQPALDLTIPDNMPIHTSRNEEVRFLLRMPSWLRELVREASDDEGLSMNVWVQRTLAEMAKLSSTDAWRTIPVGDPPRALDPDDAFDPAPLPPHVPSVQPFPNIQPTPYTNPAPPYTVPSPNPSPWTRAGTITKDNVTYTVSASSDPDPGDPDPISVTSLTSLGDPSKTFVSNVKKPTMTIDGELMTIEGITLPPGSGWTPPEDDIPEPI